MMRAMGRVYWRPLVRWSASPQDRQSATPLDRKTAGPQDRRSASPQDRTRGSRTSRPADGRTSGLADLALGYCDRGWSQHVVADAVAMTDDTGHRPVGYGVGSRHRGDRLVDGGIERSSFRLDAGDAEAFELGKELPAD